MNPSWQRVIKVPEWKNNAVNRAVSLKEFASGKGINCLKAYCAGNLERHKEIEIVHFLGGPNGQRIQEELLLMGISSYRIQTQKETRTCQTILDGKGNYAEFIDPSPIVNPGEVEELKGILSVVFQDPVRMCICGTFPKGMDINHLNSAEFAVNQIIMDGLHDLQFFPAGLFMLKINSKEVEKLMHRPFDFQTCIELREFYGIGYLVVTNEDQSVHLFSEEGNYSYTVPKIQNLVNPIGAGDTLMGVLLANMDKSGVEEALKLAIASASDKCQYETIQFSSSIENAKLLNDIKVGKI